MLRIQDLIKVGFGPLQAKHLAHRDGWCPALGDTYADETWVYASSTTVTVASDATTRYQIGDKIRFKQGAGYKYYYITAVASTTVTLNGGTDYTVANAAITDLEWSRAERPFGFPDWFTYAPTLGAGGTMTYTSTSIALARFCMKGKLVTVLISVSGTTGGTPHTDLTFTLPTNFQSNALGGACEVTDTAAGLFGYMLGTGGGTIVVRVESAANWSAGAGRGYLAMLSYEAA